MGKLIYRKTPTNRTCPVSVKEWSGTRERDDVLLKREHMILKAKTGLQMDMGKMSILPKDIQLFSQRWGNIWEIPGNYRVYRNGVVHEREMMFY